MLNLIQMLLMTVLPFLAVLTLVITIHELGHFGMARLFGVAVDQFSIGFGKALISRTDRHGIEWRLGAIPLGGYVRFAGDSEASSTIPDADDLADLRTRISRVEGSAAVIRYFQFKPIWQRAAISVAGPAANFVLAVTIFSFLALLVGVTVVKPRVGLVAAGGPAARAGVLPGDLITQMNGAPLNDFTDLVNAVRLHTGDPIHLTIQRGATTLPVDVTPTRRAIKDGLTGRVSEVGGIGIGSSAAPGDVYHQRVGALTALKYGVGETWGLLSTTVTYLGRIVTGREPASQIGSVVGIAQTSGAVAKASMASSHDFGTQVTNLALNLLNFSAFISVAVGFMNLLPVPVLDGGHLAFYAYEAVARRPAAGKVQAVGYRVGLALLLSFMLFATWNDFHQIPVLKILGGLFS